MRFPLLVLSAILLANSSSNAQTAPANISRAAKSVAALVGNNLQILGTAVSIGNGYYLTTIDAHARAGSGRGQQSLRLLLAPEGLPVNVGRLVRGDGETRLGLLRVPQSAIRQQPALNEALDLSAGAADLQALTEVTVVGVPYRVGSRPDADKPIVATVPGKVVSVKRDQRRATLLEIEAPLHEAFWGAAVLDARGRLVGIVTQEMQRFNTFGAVPIERVRDFLKRPDIHFPAPTLTGSSHTNPVKIVGSVVHYLPGAPAAEASITLALADGSKRGVTITAKGGGAFEASIPPLPMLKAPSVLTVVQTSAGNTSRFQMRDRTINVGGRAVALSTVKEIDSRRLPVVTLADGTKLRGRMDGLKKIETVAGGTGAVADLSTAEMIWIMGVEPSYAPVSYKLAVTMGGETVGEALGTFAVGPAPAQLPAFALAAQEATVLISTDLPAVAGSGVGLGERRFITLRRLVVRPGPIPPRLFASPVGRPHIVPPPTVLREDEKSGLALFTPKAEPADVVNGAVELAEDSGLRELQPVQVVGAVPGMDFTDQWNRRTPLTPVQGTISALQKINGEIDRVVVFGEFHAASAGAAVLDSRGKLLAILDRPLPDGKYFSAIPVNRIRAFLAKPEIVFVPARLRATQETQPAAWSCEVLTFGRDQADPSVTLTLKLADGTTRAVPGVARGGGIYDLALPALPASFGPDNRAAPIAYTLTVTQGGRILAEQTGAIPVTR